MAGYNGYSMSNNAVSAYEYGKKPISKWKKSDIISAVEELIADDEIEINFDFDVFKKLPLATLKSEFLYSSEWHHTSEYFNKTNFYELDTSKFEDLTQSELDEMLLKSKEKKTEEPAAEEHRYAECQYLVWSGSRKHPKATECTAVGEIIGNWFRYMKGGKEYKKSVTANGFKILREISAEEYDKNN